MKKNFIKKHNTKNFKTLVSGGFGKYGHYLYGGAKTKNGISGGASIGTRGRQIYFSTRQNRLKYNLDSGNVSIRNKKYRK